MSEQKLYTLAEARRALTLEECNRFGHDFNVMLKIGSLEPVSVTCSRCGQSWGIA